MTLFFRKQSGANQKPISQQNVQSLIKKAVDGMNSKFSQYVDQIFQALKTQNGSEYVVTSLMNAVNQYADNDLAVLKVLQVFYLCLISESAYFRRYALLCLPEIASISVLNFRTPVNKELRNSLHIFSQQIYLNLALNTPLPSPKQLDLEKYVQLPSFLQLKKEAQSKNPDKVASLSSKESDDHTFGDQIQKKDITPPVPLSNYQFVEDLIEWDIPEEKSPVNNNTTNFDDDLLFTSNSNNKKPPDLSISDQSLNIEFPLNDSSNAEIFQNVQGNAGNLTSFQTNNQITQSTPKLLDFIQQSPDDQLVPQIHKRVREKSYDPPKNDYDFFNNIKIVTNNVNMNTNNNIFDDTNNNNFTSTNGEYIQINKNNVQEEPNEIFDTNQISYFQSSNRSRSFHTFQDTKTSNNNMPNRNDEVPLARQISSDSPSDNTTNQFMNDLDASAQNTQNGIFQSINQNSQQQQQNLSNNNQNLSNSIEYKTRSSSLELFPTRSTSLTQSPPPNLIDQSSIKVVHFPTSPSFKDKLNKTSNSDNNKRSINFGSSNNENNLDIIEFQDSVNNKISKNSTTNEILDISSSSNISSNVKTASSTIDIFDLSNTQNTNASNKNKSEFINLTALKNKNNDEFLDLSNTNTKNNNKNTDFLDLSDTSNTKDKNINTKFLDLSDTNNTNNNNKNTKFLDLSDTNNTNNNNKNTKFLDLSDTSETNNNNKNTAFIDLSDTNNKSKTEFIDISSNNNSSNNTDFIDLSNNKAKSNDELFDLSNKNANKTSDEQFLNISSKSSNTEILDLSDTKNKNNSSNAEIIDLSDANNQSNNEFSNLTNTSSNTEILDLSEPVSPNTNTDSNNIDIFNLSSPSKNLNQSIKSTKNDQLDIIDLSSNNENEISILELATNGPPGSNSSSSNNNQTNYNQISIPPFIQQQQQNDESGSTKIPSLLSNTTTNYQSFLPQIGTHQRSFSNATPHPSNPIIEPFTKYNNSSLTNNYDSYSITGDSGIDISSTATAYASTSANNTDSTISLIDDENIIPLIETKSKNQTIASSAPHMLQQQQNDMEVENSSLLPTSDSPLYSQHKKKKSSKKRSITINISGPIPPSASFNDTSSSVSIRSIFSTSDSLSSHSFSGVENQDSLNHRRAHSFMQGSVLETIMEEDETNNQFEPISPQSSQTGIIADDNFEPIPLNEGDNGIDDNFEPISIDDSGPSSNIKDSIIPTANNNSSSNIDDEGQPMVDFVPISPRESEEVNESINNNDNADEDKFEPIINNNDDDEIGSSNVGVVVGDGDPLNPIENLNRSQFEPIAKGSSNDNAIYDQFEPISINSSIDDRFEPISVEDESLNQRGIDNDGFEPISIDANEASPPNPPPPSQHYNINIGSFETINNNNSSIQKDVDDNFVPINSNNGNGINNNDDVSRHAQIDSSAFIKSNTNIKFGGISSDSVIVKQKPNSHSIVLQARTKKYRVKKISSLQNVPAINLESEYSLEQQNMKNSKIITESNSQE